jgi:5-methylcytosine-specific restriction endonuclease McrBC regulatory subunit McrC
MAAMVSEDLEEDEENEMFLDTQDTLSQNTETKSQNSQVSNNQNQQSQSQSSEGQKKITQQPKFVDFTNKETESLGKTSEITIPSSAKNLLNMGF